MYSLECDLIAIISKNKELAKYNKDRLHIDLISDELMRLIYVDIMDNLNDDKYNYYNLMAKWGNSLPDLYIEQLECAVTLDKIIEQLHNLYIQKRAYQLSNDFTIDYKAHNNPSLDTFLESLSALNVSSGTMVLSGVSEWVEHSENLLSQADIKTIKTIYGEFRYGSVIYLSGRPGMWKSTAAINMFFNETVNAPCLMVSMEMQKAAINEIMQQIATDQSIIDYKTKGGFTYEQMDKFSTSTVMRNNKLFISDNPICSTSDIERMIVNLDIRKCKPHFIIVDNLNLIKKHTSNEYEALSQITRELKVLAMKHNVVLMVIAHVNRENTNRNNKKPKLSDLRGSGTIEQDADYVVFLHREEYYYYELGENCPREFHNRLEWYQAKNRFGTPLNGYREINLSLSKDIRELNENEIIDYKSFKKTTKDSNKF